MILVFSIGMYFFKQNDSFEKHDTLVLNNQEEEIITDSTNEYITDLFPPEKFTPSYIDASGTLISSIKFNQPSTCD